MHIAVNVIKNSLLRSVLGCQWVVIKQVISQTNAKTRTKIRHRTKVILIAVAAVGMYKYANWSGSGLPVSLVQQVGQEKFSVATPNQKKKHQQAFQTIDWWHHDRWEVDADGIAKNWNREK